MTWLPVQIGMLILLICASAFFSGAETTYFSLNPIRIHRIKRFRPQMARRIEQLMARPTQILSSVLIGNTLVNIVAAALGFAVAEALVPHYGELLAAVGVTLLMLVFGEVAPKRYAIRHADRLAVLLVPLMDGLIFLLTPARMLLDAITPSFEKHFRPGPKGLTGEEFRTVVGMSHEEGILTREERAMVDGIIRLEKLTASDIMTPRVDLIGIDLDRPIEEQIGLARQSRLQYLPAYRKTLDHIEGFLDVLRFLLSPARDIKAALIPHFYVPDTAPLDQLLTMFQSEKLRLAIVIDEYGGTAGLITRGDILEEIVQDVEKGHNVPRLRIEPQGPNRWLVDGSTSLEDINDQLGLALAAEGVDRIAGWVTAHTQRIPKPSEVVEDQHCRITVLEVKKRRLRTLALEKL